MLIWRTNLKKKELQELLRKIRNVKGKNPDWYLHEGDKVNIDVDRIMSRKEFKKLQPEYQDFVHGARESVFTVHIYRKKSDGFTTLIELVEAPKWLFVESDLLKIKNGG